MTRYNSYHVEFELTQIHQQNMRRTRAQDRLVTQAVATSRGRRSWTAMARRRLVRMIHVSTPEPAIAATGLPQTVVG